MKHRTAGVLRTVKATVVVIGVGNWGTSLCSALKAARVPVRAIRSTQPVDRAALAAKVLWLCVPDDAIPLAAQRLITRADSLSMSLRGKIVVHSSGALSSHALLALSRAGASTGSVHPVMTFPSRRVVPLQGVSFGVEGDRESRRVMGALVRTIGGRPFPVKAETKALYHAVGMLCSPLLVSHLAAAQQVAALAGFKPSQARALIEPIARATMSNVFSRGVAKSFSGPIARGDVASIRLHLQSLEPHPMLAALYRALAGYAVEALPAAGREDLRKLLRSKQAFKRMRD